MEPLRQIKAGGLVWPHTQHMMPQPTPPFAITGPIGPALDALLSDWQDLRRGEADVPFWDDLSMPQARKRCGEIFLLDVFERPERCRLAAAEVGLSQEDMDRVLGHFIDEVDLPSPFQVLRAQASVTIETRRPTLYVHVAASPSDSGYERLLLPAWGEGQVRMLLGAVQRR